jgi:hypothetical protein
MAGYCCQRGQVAAKPVECFLDNQVKLIGTIPDSEDWCVAFQFQTCARPLYAPCHHQIVMATVFAKTHNTLVTLLETISRVDISKPNFAIHACWNGTGFLDIAVLWSRQLQQLLSNIVVSCKRRASDCVLWVSS